MKTTNLLFSLLLAVASTQNVCAQDPVKIELAYTNGHQTMVCNAELTDLNNEQTADTFAVMTKVRSHTDWYSKGENDAYSYYEPKKSSKWLVWASTIIGSPVGGAITVAVSTLAGPKQSNCHLPDNDLATNKEYMKGYRHEARKMKKQALWKNLSLASIGWLSIANIILL